MPRRKAEHAPMETFRYMACPRPGDANVQVFFKAFVISRVDKKRIRPGGGGVPEGLYERVNSWCARVTKVNPDLVDRRPAKELGVPGLYVVVFSRIDGEEEVQRELAQRVQDGKGTSVRRIWPVYVGQSSRMPKRFSCGHLGITMAYNEAKKFKDESTGRIYMYLLALITPNTAAASFAELTFLSRLDFACNQDHNGKTRRMARERIADLAKELIGDPDDDSKNLADGRRWSRNYARVNKSLAAAAESMFMDRPDHKNRPS